MTPAPPPSDPRPPLGRAAAAGIPWLLFTAIILFALNLRGPVVEVSAIIHRIQDDLDLSASAAGLLISLPVLCFAFATPLASLVIKKAGPELAVSTSILGIIAGTVIRSAGDATLTFLGTVVIGTAITVGNIVVPIIIRRDISPGRQGAATAAYTSALNIGAMATVLGTAPLANAFGWRAALLIWSSVAIVALIAWVLAVGWRRSLLPPVAEAEDTSTAATVVAAEAAADDTAHRSAKTGDHSPVWRSKTVWLLSIAFAGQAFSYYAISAWLPALLADRLGIDEVTAGATSTVFQGMAVVGAFAISFLGRRYPSRVLFIIAGIFWVSLPLGLMIAPQLWLLWSITGGAAQGSGFTIVMLVVVRISRGDNHARKVSSAVQGIGYVGGAMGPTVLGFFHDLSNNWVTPLFAVVATTLTFAILGVASSRRSERGAL